MLKFELDSKGPYQIIWPKNPADILATAQTCLTYYATLVPGEQTPGVNIPALQNWYTIAASATHTASLSETNRGSNAETLKQALAQLPPLIDKIHIRLQAQNLGNLANVEYWGFPVTMGTYGLKIAKPRTQTQKINWLIAYIARETSLDPAERITDPPLSQMQTLLTTIQTALTARNTGRNQREINIATRDQALVQLLNHLQHTAASLVLFKYNGIVTNDLQLYGFTIQAKTAPPKNGSEAPPASE